MSELLSRISSGVILDNKKLSRIRKKLSKTSPAALKRGDDGKQEMGRGNMDRKVSGRRGG
jgi:hypothetical protein